MPENKTEQKTTVPWDGFYPPHPCKRCGKMLRGKDSGYPAELYAGTATGLCYPCTSEGPYFTGEVLVSGAKVYSHPPSCPSHRRDRNTYYFFEDCKKCQFGTVWKHSPGPFGGTYHCQCEECSNRHYSHPTIVAQAVARSKRGWKLRVFGAMAEKKLISAGVPFWSKTILTNTKSFKTMDNFNTDEKALYDLHAAEATKLAKDMDDSLSLPEGYPLLTKQEYARLFRKDGQFIKELPQEYVDDLEKVAVKQSKRRKS